MSLSEEDRRRIRDEEIFREEVRRTVAEKPSQTRTPKQKIWDFLNTTVGFWLLSVISVSCLSFVYAEHQNSLLKKRENAETISQIDTEISYRLEHFERSINIAENSDDTLNIYLVAIRQLIVPNPQFTMLSDFKERSLPSLLYELESLVPESQKLTVKETRQAFGQMHYEEPMLSEEQYQERILNFLKEAQERESWHIEAL